MPSEAPIPHEITRLLHKWKDGDRDALGQVVTLAYNDLRAIAAGYLNRGAAGNTLQATGLVNELYLKLAQVRSATLKDRRHFFTFSAQLMRMILIDYSRQTKALKRPSSAARVPLHEEMAWIDAASEEMLALNTALDELEAVNGRKVRVIELRFFLGCTNDEAADLLGVSRATIERDLEFTTAWLYRRLTGLSSRPAADAEEARNR
jgi:RNA polymerase sigma factor (TIGR02999 family)